MSRISFFILSFCVLGLADSFQWGDSGIGGPKHTEILSSLERLQSQYSQIATLEDYGKSVQGRTLRMLVVMKNPATLIDRTAIVISGSIHGNEFLNIEDRLPEEILKRAEMGPVSQFLNRGGAFIFIPIVNPDGYDNRTRENAHGVDLNRDWDVKPAGFTALTEVETKLFAGRLDGMRIARHFNYRLAVDYHCCAGALLYPWSYTKTSIPESDLQKHLAIGDVVKRHLPVEVGTTGDILGYYPLGTLKDFYYDRYHALSFTFEGRYGIENRYLDKHLAWWEETLPLVMMDRFQPELAWVSKELPFFAFAN